MSRYAENTAVGSDRSRAEIERTLMRYGADQFMYGIGRDRAVVAFQAHNRRIQFELPLPDRDNPEFTQTPTGRARSANQAEQEYEKAIRQRWRALALVIKAKLEAVEAGITEFEDEFLAHIMLPNGQRFGDWARPQIHESYESNGMPELMPGAR
jgi:hypothetical protein